MGQVHSLVCTEFILFALLFSWSYCKHTKEQLQKPSEIRYSTEFDGKLLVDFSNRAFNLMNRSYEQLWSVQLMLDVVQTVLAVIHVRAVDGSELVLTDKISKDSVSRNDALGQSSSKILRKLSLAGWRISLLIGRDGSDWHRHADPAFTCNAVESWRSWHHTHLPRSQPSISGSPKT